MPGSSTQTFITMARLGLPAARVAGKNALVLGTFLALFSLGTDYVTDNLGPGSLSVASGFMMVLGLWGGVLAARPDDGERLFVMNRPVSRGMLLLGQLAPTVVIAGATLLLVVVAGAALGMELGQNIATACHFVAYLACGVLAGSLGNRESESVGMGFLLALGWMLVPALLYGWLGGGAGMEKEVYATSAALAPLGATVLAALVWLRWVPQRSRRVGARVIAATALGLIAHGVLLAAWFGA